MLRIITDDFKIQFPNSVKALERDNYKCSLCGCKDYLIVHHKDESRRNGLKSMNNNLDNLMTLCKKCHAEIHMQDISAKKLRNFEIVKMREYGFTYSEIGLKFGISRQRVYQIWEHKIAS